MVKHELLKESTYAQGERKVIATLGAIRGTKGTIELSKRNVANLDKAVAVMITTDAGVKLEAIACSKPVSEAIRNHSIKVSQLWQLEVLEHTISLGANKGTVIPLVAMPESGISGVITAEAKDDTKEAFVPSSMFNDDSLVAM